MWVLWNLSPKPAKLAELFVLAREVFGGGGSYVGYGHRPALLSGVQWNELVWSEWLTDSLTDWLTLVKGKSERERCDVFRKMEVFRAVLRAVRAYDFDMTRELPHLFKNAVLWTAAACRVSRPAKTCRKIPKKTPLSAESYRSQDWRKYADSRGDPNRSSVAETKTRMSKILSELTSQRVMFQKW